MTEAIVVPPKVYKYLVDPLERAGSTFLQQLSIVLLATGGGQLLVKQNWLAAVDAAGFAGILALVSSYALTFAGLGFADPVVDFARRVLMTFLQSFAGALAASAVDPSVLHAQWKGAAAVGVIAALTAALKAAGGVASPRTLGASVIPIRGRHEVTTAEALAA